MITDKIANFSLRLDPIEREALQRLANQTGRTPAGVLKRLLFLAELPDNRRALGVYGDHQTEQAQEMQAR